MLNIALSLIAAAVIGNIGDLVVAPQMPLDISSAEIKVPTPDNCECALSKCDCSEEGCSTCAGKKDDRRGLGKSRVKRSRALLLKD
jgi:hypothetical protein